MITTYEGVATEMKLDAPTAMRYVQYMRTRWPEKEALHCQVGYAQEWAARFQAGVEYSASDSHGQAILRGMP